MKLHLLAAGLALVASASQANVLDFGQSGTPMFCSSTADGLGAPIACANGSYFLQSYGDIASAVDVTYSAPRINDGRSLRWWAENYNDLYGVLWADSSDADSRARIEIKPLGGKTVTLTHFDFGAFLNSTRDTTINVFAIGNPIALFTYAGPVGSGLMHNGFDLNVSSTTGLRLEWKDSAFNVGVDNVTFTLDAVGAVPEPSTYALLLAGLAVCGAAARRRRR